LVAILTDYLADEPAGEWLWPGSWGRRATEMLKIDLAAAKTLYVDASARYADFHAQRHTYITVAGRNLPPQMAQMLARHNDYTTTRNYPHLGAHDTAGAVAQLPPLLPRRRRGPVASRDWKRGQTTQGREGGSPKKSATRLPRKRHCGAL
jgi:hypothetical protein